MSKTPNIKSPVSPPAGTPLRRQIRRPRVILFRTGNRGFG
jgi:hypothetical protein